MRSRLLLGTILAGGALAPGAALAQLDVTIGGTVGFSAGYAEADASIDTGDGPIEADIDGFDFQSESEIVIRADGVADNGLEYGAKVEIMTSTNDVLNADEVSLYIGGGWGRLEFGDFDGAADEMSVFAPNAGTGILDGDYSDWLPFGALIQVPNTEDSTKINYYSPRFAGFRLGVAYAPYVDFDADDDGPGTGENVEIRDTSDMDDGLEFGIDYENTFGSVDVLIGAAVTHLVNNELNWGVGAQVGFGAFTVGGGFVYIDDDIFETWGANVGATYEMGPWAFGVNYAYADGDAGDADVTQHTYGVGVTYTLAPGLQLMADVVGVNAEVSDGDDDDAFLDADGWVALTKIEVTF